MTCVVDHDAGRLIWAAPGQDKATLATFFDALGPERSSQITHVSADGAAWIASAIAAKAPKTIRCTDPFYVVKWATDALDEVRRTAWNDARKAARHNDARRTRGRPAADDPARPDSARAAGIKNCRYALWKNPENLTEKQQAKLVRIVQTDPRLARAYHLEEGLRVIFKLPLANGRFESMNTKIRLMTRIAFGFTSPDALIALAMLSLGGHKPVLPGRNELTEESGEPYFRSA